MTQLAAIAGENPHGRQILILIAADHVAQYHTQTRLRRIATNAHRQSFPVDITSQFKVKAQALAIVQTLGVGAESAKNPKLLTQGHSLRSARRQQWIKRPRAS